MTGPGRPAGGASSEPIPDLIDLADPRATRPELTGSKAARLAELLQAGFPVPAGFVVTTAAPGGAGDRAGLPAGVAGLVEEAARAYTAPFAVRSSAVAEDLPGLSYAGQYETVLDVGVEGLAEAIRACRLSARAERVASYARALNAGAVDVAGGGADATDAAAGPGVIAVLVQELVRATSAGVAFTADPRTGDRGKTVIDAVKGIGERLVSGVAVGEEWVVDAGGARRAGPDRRVLSVEQATAIAGLARRVEARAGVPQDIEWAIDGGGLRLLQARPVTGLPEAVSWDAPVPGLWLRMFRLGEWLGEPVTPLFETWFLDRAEARLFGCMEDAVPQGDPRPYHVTVNGWYFTTANFTPHSVAHGLYLALRFLLPAALRRPRALSVLTTRWAHVGMAHFERLWRAGPKRHYEAVVADARRRVDGGEARELPALVDALCDTVGEELFFFFMAGGSAWKTEIPLARFYAGHLASRLGGTHQQLLQGLRPEAGTTTHGVVSLDWREPTLGELGVVEGGGARAAAAERRREAERAARAALQSTPRALRTFDALLGRAQRFGRLREEQAEHLTLAWPVLRVALLRIGAVLSGAGWLGEADEVFFLTRDEVGTALEGSARGAVVGAAAGGADSPGAEPVGGAVPGAEPPRAGLAGMLRARRRAWEAARRLTPPDHVGRMGWIQAAIFGGSLRALGGQGPAARDAWLSGSPASPGRATGPARVIRSPAEFGRLEEGDVLVAPATSPGWTPLFTRAVAVVTDTGSLMAHASLVAREYGLPAVIGCGDATARIRDGQVITVDGTAGTIERHGG